MRFFQFRVVQKTWTPEAVAGVQLAASGPSVAKEADKNKRQASWLAHRPRSAVVRFAQGVFYVADPDNAA